MYPVIFIDAIVVKVREGWENAWSEFVPFLDYDVQDARPHRGELPDGVDRIRQTL